jgi:putative GTP pyrophosphokinase
MVVDFGSDTNYCSKMSYSMPPASKSAVRRAGKSIAAGQATNLEIALVDQWRASHGYVINTFQAWIKRHIVKQDFEVEFAQRLKRKRTVDDKLRRRDRHGRPLITDVTAMHDLAGCRMIFDTIDDLIEFRTYLHSSDVMRNVQHELRHEVEKYDYIESPKSTGYRGIHDVYRHYPRRHRKDSQSGVWNGLSVEIQYRTRAQHAWATAVEISDLLDGERTKFEMDQSDRGRFFSLSSEIIARNFEGYERSFLERTTSDIQGELQSLEDSLGIMQRLRALKQFEVGDDLQRHNVLNIKRVASGELELEALSFQNATLAIAKATELEADENSVNAVYVRSDNPNQLRSAYRNYFYDPVDFVELLQSEAELE